MVADVGGFYGVEYKLAVKLELLAELTPRREPLTHIYFIRTG